MDPSCLVAVDGHTESRKRSRIESTHEDRELDSTISVHSRSALASASVRNLERFTKDMSQPKKLASNREPGHQASIQGLSMPTVKDDRGEAQTSRCPVRSSCTSSKTIMPPPAPPPQQDTRRNVIHNHCQKPTGGFSAYNDGTMIGRNSVRNLPSTPSRLAQPFSIPFGNSRLVNNGQSFRPPSSTAPHRFVVEPERRIDKLAGSRERVFGYCTTVPEVQRLSTPQYHYPAFHRQRIKQAKPFDQQILSLPEHSFGLPSPAPIPYPDSFGHPMESRHQKRFRPLTQSSYSNLGTNFYQPHERLHSIPQGVGLSSHMRSSSNSQRIHLSGTPREGSRPTLLPSSSPYFQAMDQNHQTHSRLFSSYSRQT